MLRFIPVLIAPIAFVALGCDVPTPLAPAEPIGAVPTWGEGFAVPTEQPASMLGNTGLPAATTSPGDTGDWAGGEPALGKAVWTAMCQRCHGENGEGGAMAGNVKVPALNDPGVQAALTDRAMARSIALGKGGMPSFMRDLDKPKLSGVIAHIRTLKKQP